jgi:putative ABC transport system ATP-binding protein
MERMQIGHTERTFSASVVRRTATAGCSSQGFDHPPKLILADEPTGNLDSHNGEQVMQLLEKLNADGTTIVMVTHSLNHAERAHRVVNLFDGQIITERMDRIFEPHLQ